MTASTLTAPPRRHDLDALRAFAMLLGIVLHGALTFMPIPWPIQDSQQNELFGLVVAAIHGFRMPVFFVMSGFFTAMLWRRRGLQALLAHRFRRIALPLLLGVVTIVPAVNWVSLSAIQLGSADAPPATPAAGELDRQDPATGLTALSLAIAFDQADTVEQLLAGGAAVDAPNRDGSTALIVAAVFGRSAAAGRLLEAGAAVDTKNGDGSTALHTAAFFGRAGVVERLLAAGADTSIPNAYGQTALQVTATDWKTTAHIAKLVRVEVEREELEAGRAEIVEMLRAGSGAEARSGAGEGGGAWLRPLLYKPFFHHLWFLWFLCWLVAGFAVYALVAERLGWKGLPSWLILSPLRFLWLIPLTLLPQLLMGRTAPVFGADTSAGLLPMPHVLAFYAIFFAFGALYYDSRDDEGRVGRWWYHSLPIGLFLIYPVGLGFVFAGGESADTAVHRLLSALLQASYPWVMTFGLMGLFRRLLQRENRVVRYLSDASYWLYLVHLPLVMGAQLLVRDWPLAASLKLALICSAVTAFLLAVYQLAVRHTWLGRLLNGPRRRSTAGSTVASEPGGAPVADNG